ncbi:MAG: RNA polymerase factor sigma-54 [Peptococcia bacterium]
MNIHYGLNLQQSQKLMMTPELRQAIKILQLSAIELGQYVNQILLENPLMEVKEEADPFTTEQRKEKDINWENYLRDYRENRNYEGYTGMWEVKEEFPWENLIVHDVNLQEHLLSQLGCLPLTDLQQRVGQYLIGNINSTGYLTVTVEQAAYDLKVPKKLVEEVLQLVQSFEPAGVGARHLRECLLLQLKQQNLLNEEVKKLIEEYLDDLGAGKYQKVAAALNLSVIRIQELADLIKKLNPKPGASFASGERIRYIAPDIFIERVGGEYLILLNDRLLPRLTISKAYSSIYLREGAVDEKTKKFVENKLNQAMWVIQSINHRQRTLYRLAKILLKKQRQFFDKGIKYLQPLTLKQVAEELGVHESTVSRATTNKYMQTPHGLFELKFFFSSGYKMDTGRSTSVESIKKFLQEVIATEDPTRPYSDQALADLMEKKGLKIARRTITKYRNELGILNRGQRRRY